MSVRTNSAASCLRCDASLTAATPVTPGTHPREGALSICGYCGHVAVFRADLTLRPIAPSELSAVREALVAAGATLDAQS